MFVRLSAVDETIECIGVIKHFRKGEMTKPTPHGPKLKELSSNSKLPAEDHKAVASAISAYEKWISDMTSLKSNGEEKVKDLVKLLNGYKRKIDIDLIWDSQNDFLFRQRGQLKLDNSITEEFLPWLVDPAIIKGIDKNDIYAGPTSAFASTYFGSALSVHSKSPMLKVRAKDQDFTLSRPVFIAASFDKDFDSEQTNTQSVSLAYIAAECKTNLDKTMFQEASATAHDLKIAVPSSRYFLMCEFLDMTPISTSGTDIDEVLILRGKRMSSNIRKDYSSAESRKSSRDSYIDFYDSNPVRVDVIQRFVNHLSEVFNDSDPDEIDVVTKGFF